MIFLNAFLKKYIINFIKKFIYKKMGNKESNLAIKKALADMVPKNDMSLTPEIIVFF